MFVWRVGYRTYLRDTLGSSEIHAMSTLPYPMKIIWMLTSLHKNLVKDSRQIILRLKNFYLQIPKTALINYFQSKHAASFFFSNSVFLDVFQPRMLTPVDSFTTLSLIGRHSSTQLSGSHVRRDRKIRQPIFTLFFVTINTGASTVSKWEKKKN